jgi:hypothetical protein
VTPPASSVPPAACGRQPGTPCTVPPAVPGGAGAPWPRCPASTLAAGHSRGIPSLGMHLHMMQPKHQNMAPLTIKKCRDTRRCSQADSANRPVLPYPCRPTQARWSKCLTPEPHLQNRLAVQCRGVRSSGIRYIRTTILQGSTCQSAIGQHIPWPLTSMFLLPIMTPLRWWA